MMCRKLQGIIYFGYLILFFISTGLFGCWINDDDSEEAVLFNIVVVSDVHVRVPGNLDDHFYNNQDNINKVQATIDTINEYYSDADFVAVTGDLVGCLFSKDPDDYLTGSANPAETFKQLFDELIPPYHATLGNHDYYTGFNTDIDEHIMTSDTDAVEAVWKKVLETDPYYSFEHKGVQMIFLNSNRGPKGSEICPGYEIETLCKGSFDTEQMVWLESCLEQSDSAVIFCHHPPEDGSDSIAFPLLNAYSIDSDDRFYEITEHYKDKIIAIFSGHVHLWQEYMLFDSIPVYGAGPVGDSQGSPENMYQVTINTASGRVDVSRH